MKSNLPKTHITDIVMGMLMQTLFFCPWIQGTVSRYNIHMYLYECVRNHSNLEPYRRIVLNGMKNPPAGLRTVATCFFVSCIFGILVQVLALSYAVLSKHGKYISRILLMIVEAVWGGLFAILYLIDTDTFSIYTDKFVHVVPVAVQIFYILIFTYIFVWMILGKAMEEWDDISNRAKEEREAKKEYRKERKRRLYFPGKYSSLYFRILWKDLKYRWKDVAYLFACSCLSTFLLFVGIGMRSVLAGKYGEDQGVLGLGLSEIIKNFVIVIVLISLFLMTTMLIFYRKKRLANNGLYQILGMRSNVNFLAWIGEVIFCMLLGLVVGLLLGSVILRCLCIGMKYGVPEIGTLGNPSAMSYVSTIIGMGMIGVFSFGFAHDVQMERETADSRGASIKSEPMPGRHCYVGLIVGLITVIASLLRYGQRRSAENLWFLVFFFVGLFLVLYNGGAVYLQCKKKNTSNYLESLPDNHMIRYRYKTTIQYVMLFTIIHICALFYFTTTIVSNQIASKEQNLYPYDYVLLANSGDQNILDKIQTECYGEVSTFSMVRATTMDSTEILDNPPKIPSLQGQNIGVSESTYRQLEILVGKIPKDNLNLDEEGKRIYVVYQQDFGTSAKPLDWYLWTREPYVHIGQPLLEYNVFEYRTFYEKRHISGSETSSLIGCFKQGKYENLLVFSNKYFEKIKDNWKYTDMYTGDSLTAKDAVPGENVHEGPTILALVKIPDIGKDRANQLIKMFQANHAYDESFDPLVKSAYVKTVAQKQRKIERLSQEVIASSIWWVLLIMSMMLLHMKIKMERPEMEKRYRFMECFGMREKERIQKEKKEVSRFVIIPFAMSIPLSIMFTGITLYLRRYQSEVIIQYMQYAAIVWGIYLGIQTINLKRLQSYMVRKVEQNIGR